MKKSLLVTGLMLALCACANPETTKPKEANAAATTPKATQDVLSSLSKEQQAAVRALVRDTLITDPKILLEAQQAYEAQAMREQNEMASKSFGDMTTKAADLSFGPKDSKTTLIEFFDYRCGYCHAANPWLEDYLKKHPDVRIIYKELPILSEQSLIAAKAAIASNKQGKYQQFHSELMKATGDLSIDRIMQIATTVGLDTKKLQADMAKPEVLKMLETMKQQAIDVGISGTPGFVINGKLIAGFDQGALESALGAASAQK